MLLVTGQTEMLNISMSQLIGCRLFFYKLFFVQSMQYESWNTVVGIEECVYNCRDFITLHFIHVSMYACINNNNKKISRDFSDPKLGWACSIITRHITYISAHRRNYLILSWVGIKRMTAGCAFSSTNHYTNRTTVCMYVYIYDVFYKYIKSYYRKCQNCDSSNYK